MSTFNPETAAYLANLRHRLRRDRIRYAVRLAWGDGVTAGWDAFTRA